MKFKLTNEEQIRILMEKKVQWTREQYSFAIDLKVAEKIEDARMEQIARDNITRIESVLAQLDEMISELAPEEEAPKV